MNRKHRKNHKVTFKVTDYKFKSKVDLKSNVDLKSLKLRKPVLDTKVKKKEPTKTSKITQNTDLKVVNKTDSRKLVDFQPDKKYVDYLEAKDKFKSKSKHQHEKKRVIAKGFARISFIIKKNNIFFTCQNEAHKTEKGASKILSTGMIQVLPSENEKEKENDKIKIKKGRNKAINAARLQIKKRKIKKMKVSEESIRKNLRVFLKNMEKYDEKKAIKLRNFKRVRFLFLFLKVKSDLRKRIMRYIQRKWKKKIAKHVNTIFFPSLSKAFNGCRLRRPSRVKGKQKKTSFKSQR